MDTFVGIIKITSKSTIYFIKQNWEIIAFITLLFGIISLPDTLSNVSATIEEKNQVVIEWQEGTPAHQELGTAELHRTDAFAKNMIKGEFDADMLVFQFGDEADGIAGTVLEYLDNFNKWKYVLRCEDTGKKIRTIELEVGESVDVEFYYDGTMLSFDNTNEQEMNKMVIYSVADTSIARIYGNRITALDEGTTTLRLNHKGDLLEYTIKVK